MKTRKTYVWLALAAGLAVYWIAQAGELEPPRPPSGTGRSTIFQVQMPVTISTSGSYLVKENLTGRISIDADNVTLDLGGFSISGTPGVDCILAQTGTKNIVVKHGIVSGCGRNGVDLSNAGNTAVVDIIAEGNQRGIVVGEASLVLNSIARGNSDHGIVANSGGSTITGCAAEFNGGNGIQVVGTARSTISECTLQQNTFDGIGSEGIVTVSNCTVANNHDDGIQIGGSGSGKGLVRGCTASNNGDVGIEAFHNSTIVGNTCDENSGAGIKITGSDNRIDSNNVTGAVSSSIGIAVDAGGNIIVRNTASSNVTNYDLSGTNTVGEIITASGTISADPWANFSF